MTEPLRRLLAWLARHIERPCQCRSSTAHRWSVDLLEERIVPTANGARALAYDIGPGSIAPAWFERIEMPSALADADSAVTKTTAIETLEWDNSSVEVVQDEWIVQLDELSCAKLSAIKSATALLSTSELDFEIVSGLGMRGQLLLRTTGASSDLVQDWLASNDSVAYFEPNLVLPMVDQVPDDSSFANLWGLHNTGQSGGTVDADIDAPEAWELATGSAGIVTAVIDTGVDYTHADLAANIWVNPGEIAGNGIDDDGNGFVDDVHGYDFVNNDGDPMDDNSHGTHVAGTIAGVGNNGTGVAGVNWTSSIMALKFLDASGSGSTADAVLALNYLTLMRTTYGVDVRLSNNSWGGGGYSQSMYDAIAANGAAGILFVAAAGNSADNNDVTPHYPANYNLDNVISVAATDRNDDLASFSCYGATTVDLAAPGVSIYSTVPGGSYSSYSGTSMATPHVSGVAALAWSLSPDATVSRIRDVLLQGTDPIAALDGRMTTGGRLNARNTLELLGMSVVGSTPAADSTVAVPPTEFVIDFSSAYDPTSVTPADLTVNDIFADQVDTVDSDTLRFTYETSPVTTQGGQSMQIAAGAITSLAGGEAINAWQAQFLFDALPLTVISSTPSSGVTLPGAPSVIVLDFNEAVDAASVDVGDLLLDFGSVTAATVVDTDTVQYAIQPTRTEGQATYILAAGAVLDTYGAPGQEFAVSFTMDDPLTERYAATDTPLELLDDGTTLVSMLTVPDTFSIGDLDVELDITHTWDEDLVVDLVAPDGTEVRLFANVGGSGRNFTGTILDDEATLGIQEGQAPFAGRYKPLSPLSGLDGLNAAGTWRLEITDTWPYLDSGILTSWALVAQGGPMGVVGSTPAEGSVVTEPTTEVVVSFSVPYDPASVEAADLTLNETPADSAHFLDDRTVSFAFTTSPVITEGAQDIRIAEGAIGNGASGEPLGEWSVEFFYTSLVLSATPVSPALGERLLVPPTEIVLDFNRPVDPASVDVGDLALSAGTVTAAAVLDEDSVQYSVTIPVSEGEVGYTLAAGALQDTNGTPNASYVGGFVIDDPLLYRFTATDTPLEIVDDGRTVVSTITVSDSFTIADLDIELDITHTWDSDLQVVLIAPNGTRIELFADVGGSGDDFTGTILDDDAEMAITDGVAPFAGRYQPQNPLAAAQGSNVVGLWKLEITDSYPYIDGGTLNSWSLVAKKTASIADKVGVRRNSTWYLDADGSQQWSSPGDEYFTFGIAGDEPVVGDWNGDGVDEIGVYRGGMWYLDLDGNQRWDGDSDTYFAFGIAGDEPVVGDWNGDGRDEVGVHREQIWCLDIDGNRRWNAQADAYFAFGIPGDTPVVGDWDGDGTDQIGVQRNNVWFLDVDDNRRWNAEADAYFTFGAAGDEPVVGDWNGDGADEVGVHSGQWWFLDLDGNRRWNAEGDTYFAFGVAGDIALVGCWDASASTSSGTGLADGANDLTDLGSTEDGNSHSDTAQAGASWDSSSRARQPTGRRTTTPRSVQDARPWDVSAVRPLAWTTLPASAVDAVFADL